MPPQDGTDPSWSLNSVGNMSYAWIFHGGQNVNLKTLSAAQQRTLLYNDWGNMGFNGTRSYAGTGLGWGGAWVNDPATGIGYVATAQPGPDFNATTRPGPNLWSNSILAIEMTIGKIMWVFQSWHHD